MKTIVKVLVLGLVFWFARGVWLNKQPVVNKSEELLRAVETGNQSEVVRLLDTKVDVNTVDKSHNTVLYFAACRGQVEIATILLDRGANINAVGSSKDTPLHCAAMLSQKAAAELLINRGANVNLVSADGYTPLREASDPAIQALLVAKGAHL